MPKRALAVLWTLAIIAACTIPGRSLPSSDLFELDKVIHFGLFFAFGMLWLWAYPRHAWAVWGLGLLYAGGTEIYQGWLPFDRFPDVYDFIANALGLSTAVGIGVVRDVRAKK